MKKSSQALLLKIYEDNPEMRKIEQVVDVLRNGGIIIYPTDTVYGLGCDIYNSRAVEKIYRLKNLKSNKAYLSFICYDLSHISDFTRNVSTPVFKIMKKALPGPYTFILQSNNRVPKELNSPRKTVGIRVPDNNIARAIVKELGNPIITTSIKDEDEVKEYSTDPGLIYDKFKSQVDLVIDGGPGRLVASTVIDCSEDEFTVLREGLGKTSHLFD
ncbi:MAG: threonylcarbamoyl-AMP synthase [Cyclobacteriaceae bacterium]|nr:threonylcarbamoyl-AMP synthase [Cyclobacteriaceae bacterium]